MSKPFDSERETRVLLEDVRSEVKVIAEGHGAIVRRLDKVEDDIQELKTQTDRRFNHIDQRFDRLEGQLGQLQVQVGSVLKDHEHRLKSVERRGLVP